MEEQIEFIEYIYHAPSIRAFWLRLTALLAASHSTLVAVKPITSRETLKPKVEIIYANLTGRIPFASGALADTVFNLIGRARSEDCLLINVQTPVGTTKGDNETDVIRGELLNYNVGGLVRTSVDLGQPIIGVSANYRLNAFGFSASREMREDEGEGATDLFRGAMALSSGPVMVESAERAQPFFDHMVERTGCADASDKIACLKVTDFDDIMASVNEEGMPGKMASVPLITGDMRDEGTLFSLLAQLETLSDDDFADYFQTIWWPKASDADIAGLMKLYPADITKGYPFSTGILNAVTPKFKRLAAVVGDFSFQAQRRNLLAHYNVSEQTVWNYVTDVSIPSAGLLPGFGVLTHLPLLGSFHAFDVRFYMFAGLPYALSKNTQAYQVTAISFIRTLSPNNHGLDFAEWPRYSEEGLETSNFKESGPEVTRDDWRVEAMQYINDHPASFLL
ncbi:carotenoid ester lipase [Colletotrichum tamarilloi]|uniref:Carotenoid ester lipase n=1 Tax=Colletotrichum tamarilloi TaxID=1209934 RepID=A0ABQ9QHR2_9PEZI|nr:carotenoid ester lipase [Colletotrichum tamarilloi]KAK1470935.1 carotenoid ester lipase [Colletotrichum tamarilloi]